MINQLDEYGKEHGLWENYCHSNTLVYKGEFKNGRQCGLWIVYWKNYNLAYKGEFKNEKRRGLWCEIYYDK